MQYMLMCCIDENHWQGLAQRERDRVMQDYGAWIASIRASRHHVATGKLRPSATATTIRQKAGRPVITDGPFAETKEQLGGFYLIEASDLDTALSWASRCPGASRGTIEVRPIWSM